MQADRNSRHTTSDAGRLRLVFPAMGNHRYIDVDGRQFRGYLPLAWLLRRRIGVNAHL